MTEIEWQGQVVDLAGMLGWRHMHVRRTIGRGGRWTTSTSLKGFPDLLLWHEGMQRVVAAELKRERGVLSREQVDVLKSLRAAGMEAYVWKPSDLPEVQKLLSWPKAA